MTTHDLAKLLDHLRDGLARGLTAGAVKDMADAAEAIRQLPDMSLKAFAREIKPKPPKAGRKKGPPAVDLAALIERIRTVIGGTGSAESVLAEVEQLSSNQLKEVLKAYDRKGTTKKDDNLNRVRALIQNNDSAVESSTDRPGYDPALVESGVQLYVRLRDSRDLSIQEVRTQFEPIRFYPKSVVEEISQRLGYTPDGSRDAIAKRLLSNLESIKMHQLRGDLILSGA